MIVAFQNSSETLWLPIYSLNDKVYLSSAYKVFSLFQVVLYIFTGFIVVKSCNIFLTVKVFHENKSILMVWFLLQWFEGILAKMVILPYQTGVIVISTDPDRAYYGWWTQDTTRIPVVQNHITPLFLSSWIFWHYVYSMIFALVALTIERFLATYFIQDYENVPRRFISFLLILLTNIITIPYSFLIVKNRIPFWIAFAQCVINGLFVFFGYLIFWRINVYLKNQLIQRNPQCKYSLARKFQIEENLRSFKLAIKMVIAAVIYLSMSLAILICLMFEVFKGYEPILVHIFDNIILGAALILSLTLIWCSPSWKDNFLKQIPVIKNYRSPRVGHFNILPESSTTESDVYFRQLKSAWL